jgi:hypothetical protein
MIASQRAVGYTNEGKQSGPEKWENWTYGPGGKLSDVLIGSGNEERNHYLNFKYDTAGRLVSLEYWQNGAAFSSSEIKYEGNTITDQKFNLDRKKVFEKVVVLDEYKRVVDLKVSDSDNGQLKLWYHSRFRYDAQGRVTEQNTDPYDFGDGSDYAPLPGKLVVDYDDAHHTREQRFYDPDGKLVLRTLAELDRDGVAISMKAIDAAGKEQTAGETFVSGDRKLSTRAGRVRWEVAYDAHGNWTERKRWFIPADGAERVLVRVISRKIQYR